MPRCRMAPSDPYRRCYAQSVCRRNIRVGKCDPYRTLQRVRRTGHSLRSRHARRAGRQGCGRTRLLLAQHSPLRSGDADPAESPSFCCNAAFVSIAVICRVDTARHWAGHLPKTHEPSATRTKCKVAASAFLGDLARLADLQSALYTNWTPPAAT